MRTLEGKVAVVTGSGRGIGRHVALKLASAGASVVVNDLDDAPARQAADEIVSAGGAAVACPGDVTAPDFAQRIINTAVDTFAGLHIIVNNAGYTWDSVIQNMTDEQWDVIIDVHLKAPFRILRAAQPVISVAAKTERRQNGVPACRKVVNISSVAGVGGNPGQANYAAAKAGLIGLTKTLSKEWGRYNVTVNAVAFGLIKTRLSRALASEESQIDVAGRRIRVGVNPALLDSLHHSVPLGRIGTAEEAAGAVYLLCTPESDYISGQVVTCAGGASL